MRTTLTLDPDVSKLVERVCKERRASFKQVVNDALRRALTQPPPKRGRYRTKARACGPLLANYDNVAEVLALAEGEDHR